MSEVDDSQQRVSFTVKELLTQINGKLDTMALAIAAKAEASALERLAGKVETLEATDRANKALGEIYLAEYNKLKADVAHLKENATGDKSVKKYKRWLIATGIALVACVGTLAAVAVKFIH